MADTDVFRSPPLSGVSRSPNAFRSRKKPVSRRTVIIVGASCMVVGVLVGFVGAASALGPATGTDRLMSPAAKGPVLPLPTNNARLYLRIEPDAVITCVGEFPTAYFIRAGVLQSAPADVFVASDPSKESKLNVPLGQVGNIQVAMGDLKDACRR